MNGTCEMEQVPFHEWNLLTKQILMIIINENLITITPAKRYSLFLFQVEFAFLIMIGLYSKSSLWYCIDRFICEYTELLFSIQLILLCCPNLQLVPDFAHVQVFISAATVTSKIFLIFYQSDTEIIIAVRITFTPITFVVFSGMAAISNPLPFTSGSISQQSNPEIRRSSCKIRCWGNIIHLCVWVLFCQTGLLILYRASFS